MKQRFYIRIAKGKKKCIADISSRPNRAPLKDNYSRYNSKYYPTIWFAADIEIPDEAFTIAGDIIEFKVENAKPAVEMKEVEVDG